MKSKKVWFLVGSLGGGGAERQCLMQAYALRRMGCCVTVFTLSKKGQPKNSYTAQQAISLAGFSSGSRLSNLIQVFRSIIRLNSFLRTEKNGVVLYAWLEFPHFISFFSKLFTKTKIVWAIRNSNMNIHKHYWKMNVLTKINRFFSRHIDLFIANSYAGLAFYRQELGYKMKDGLVIQNAIDTSVFYPFSLSQKNELRNKLNLPNDKIIILSVSRVDQIKNLESMLKAVAELKKKLQYNFTWIHLGAGKHDYELSLREEIKRLNLTDHVSFLGASDRVSEYMKVADLFVLPSLSEGSSNSLLEAISCKALCISTNVGDSSRFLDSRSIIHGFSGENIAQKIQWALALPEIDREDLIEKAFSSMKDQCDPKKNEIQLYAAIKSLQEKEI